MSRQRSSWICLLVGLGLLITAGRQHPGLVEARQHYQLQHAPPEDTTPLVAVTTVAFGGFRGLVADALWVRANKLQDDGQFFELVQLATWITQLEPRIPEVWAFQSWNLAYNISVLFPDPENRWRWVLHGIHLLRDEGLKHNPASASLYWDIGWLFQHKIGFDSDVAHFHYKRSWAEHMHDLFHGPGPDYATWVRNPAKRKADLTTPAAQELASLLEIHIPTPLEYTSYLKSEPPEAVANLFATHPGAPELLGHLQAQRLRQEYGMEIDTMEALEKEVGTLDWRLPQTHSLYWAWKGVPFAQAPFDQLRLHRMIYQNLSNLTRQGELVLHPGTQAFLTKPRIDLIPSTQKAFEKAFALNRATNSIQTAYRSFLIDAVILTFEVGDQKQSKQLFGLLGDYLNPGESTISYDELIQTRYFGADPKELSREAVHQRVLSMLTQSQHWQEAGERQRATELEKRAKEFYDAYQGARKDAVHRTRTGLPPFGELKALAQRPSQFP